MRIRVLFFGMLKDLTGKSGETVDLPDGASVRDVLAHYEERVPELRKSLPALAVAVNQQYSGAETRLKAEDEVALLPPVSGGSGAKERVAEPAARAVAGSVAKAELEEHDLAQGQLQRYAAIVYSRIDSQAVMHRIKRAEDGAVVVFEGVVRNQTRGRRTLYLEYEAYEAMALRQMEALGEECLKQFEVRDVALVHRLGRLEIGETSVLIMVASAHRAAAFEACRWLIDTLKRTVPIWKKEFFEDGAMWADGEPFPDAISGGSSFASGSPVMGRASK
jgi:MoaE-MoaD fusion protein